MDFSPTKGLLGAWHSEDQALEIFPELQKVCAALNKFSSRLIKFDIREGEARVKIAGAMEGKIL